MKQLSDPRADFTMLAGTWVSTNAASDGIVRIIATIEDGGLLINLFGADDGEPLDWGKTPAVVFHDRNDEGMEQPFTASYDLGFMDVVLHGFLRQGVLVLATFNHFKDNSGRSPYFVREFFYRV